MELNTYQFISKLIYLIDKNDDKLKFEEYKDDLAKNDYDTFVEIDENKYIRHGSILEKALYKDMGDDTLIMKIPQYCKGGIMFNYYFFKWGFVEYTRKISDQDKVIRIFTYLKNTKNK